MPGSHEAVTAVVAAAAEDEHVARQVQLAVDIGNDKCGAAPGIFHEFHGGRTQLFDRGAVDRPHLFGCVQTAVVATNRQRRPPRV